MKKKLISLVLMVVFMLQLLPVRQMMQLYGPDQVLAEEGAAAGKLATNDTVDFTECLSQQQYYQLALRQCTTCLCVKSFYQAMLSSSHTDDIETPPPNEVLS